MTGLIGSLCSGYGGLDLALMQTLGGKPQWVADNDAAAAKVLARRFPYAPNLGDLTAVDWADVQPVLALTVGYPCQPFSHAGRRKGAGDERNIWPSIADAIRALRPKFIFMENVAGHLSLGFSGVLGGLAEVGYDARWICIRASDVGAPHRRERVFIVAADAAGTRREGVENAGTGGDHAGERSRRQEPQRRGGPSTPTDSSGERHGRGEGEGVGRVDGEDAAGAQERQRAREIPVNRSVAAWGQYAPAIARWEHALGRPAPDPTEPTGRNGGPRLSPRFVEWMMGLPEGWVTGVDGVSTTQQLKILGNGVVPQQAAWALRALGVAP